MANFADYMIKKIAEQRSLDYSELFKNLLLKIVESDILDKNRLIVLLVNEFNKKIINGVNESADMSDAKQEAYQVVAERAEEYVR